MNDSARPDLYEISFRKINIKTVKLGANMQSSLHVCAGLRGEHEARVKSLFEKE